MAPKGPTHWCCYCPMSEDCRTKGRIKWFESEQEARASVFNHLMTSTYHGPDRGFDETSAKELADNVDVEVWPDDGSSSSGGDAKRQKTDADDGKAGKAGKGQSGTGSAASTSASSTPFGSGQSASQVIAQLRSQLAASQSQARILETRAVAAEGQVEQMNAIITRVVEQVTRASAAIKTASRVSRQASDAFDTEYHNMQDALSSLQTLYSVPVPSVTTLRIEA